MSRWKVPVSWEVCGFVDVESETLAEAMVIARDDGGILPLPKDGACVNGSWRLSTDDEEIVKAY